MAFDLLNNLICQSPDRERAMKNLKNQYTDEKLVTIFRLTDLAEAELVKNTLLDHRVDCQLGGEHQAGFTGRAGYRRHGS